MKINIIIIFCAVLMFSFGCASNSNNAVHSTTGTALIGGSFNLMDQTGKSVTEKDYLGKFSLVFFGFTHCPYVCPLGLHNMISALKNIDHFEDQITPIFISVDPERDTPERMTSYLKKFHQSIVGLTGSQEQLDQVAKAYRAYFYKSQDKNSGEYTYDHSSIIYLMDKKGQYLTHFSDGTSIEEMSATIAQYLNKQSQ